MALSLLIQAIRGKVWKPKEKPVDNINDLQEDEVQTDFDDILNQATEEELVDLAGTILPGNTVQYCLVTLYDIAW